MKSRDNVAHMTNDALRHATLTERAKTNKGQPHVLTVKPHTALSRRAVKTLARWLAAASSTLRQGDGISAMIAHLRRGPRLCRSAVYAVVPTAQSASCRRRMRRLLLSSPLQRPQARW